MRRVITAKLRPPALPHYVVERPRLEEQLAALFATQRVVTICATAGAGKTTAVLGAVRRDPRTLRWLTVDATERAPGRLLTYLEATVAAVADDADGLASGLLRDGLPHAEVAGLLAEALIGARAVVVLDEVEHLAGADDALAVVTAFVRYAPPGVTVVLVSREDLGIDPGRTGAVASIGEADLAFTRSEAEAALAKAGHHDADAGSVLDATGGWVAGVMFEAWRSADHVVGSGGERDPLYGYLSQEILGRLEPAEREFLVTTSLVDEITPEIASALSEGEPFEVMATLRRRHLPAVWSVDGTTLRLHTRFREYLQELLKRRGPDAMKPLRGRLAQMWAEQGHTEEAVEEFLRAGRPRDADAAARRAIWDVLGRLDYPIADRWLSELEHAGMDVSPPLWRAALMSAIGQWQFDRGADLGDQLRADEGAEVLATTGWQMLVLLAWCYYHVARHDEVRALPLRHDTMPQVSVVAQLFDAVCATDVRWRPPARVEGPLDVVLVRTHYVRGELAQVRELASSRWSASLSAPFVVSGLRAAGRTSEALAHYDTAAAGGNTDVWLHAIAYPEILIDLGHDEAALAALERGRRLIDRTGSHMLARVSEALCAKRALRLRHDPEAALGILEPWATPAGADGYGFVTEVMECWRGHALLMLARDAEALEELERAVDHMQRGERALELPTAGVYLSEARWRAGDEDGADEAADIALAACSLLGSRHTLLQALEDYPGVATRRMDAERGSDSAWHEIARGLLAQRRDRQVPLGRHIELEEFGEPRILVDGQEVRPRIAKSYELLAYLLDQAGHQARRDDLMTALFDGRDGTAARTYLRQAILHLREALPRPDALAVDKRTVALDPGAVVSSQAQQFEVLVAEGERLLGANRTRALEAALEVFGRGEFFAGRDSGWIDAKRARLDGLAADARLAVADTYLRAGQHDGARRHAEAAVRADPYREHGWQILMRVAAAVGDRDALIGAYRECRTALAGVGIEPCRETRELIEVPVAAVAAPLTQR
jgi:DNA-binding SARP family transcriptional activator